jgi:hypothetical protein
MKKSLIARAMELPEIWLKNQLSKKQKELITHLIRVAVGALHRECICDGTGLYKGKTGITMPCTPCVSIAEIKEIGEKLGVKFRESHG